jgi:hypothetical protein
MQGRRAERLHAGVDQRPTQAMRVDDDAQGVCMRAVYFVGLIAIFP